VTAASSTPQKEATTVAQVATPDSATASGEKKIRRRKTAAEKEASAGQVIATAPAGGGPSSAALTTAAPSSSSAAASSRAVACDESEPMITPEEIRSNLAAIRGAPMPPFVQLLQTFMHLATTNTGPWVSGADLPRNGVDKDRQRQTAFLNIIKPHFSRVSVAFGITSDRFVRELPELSETFSFHSQVPALKPQQWQLVALIMLKAVCQRVSKIERLVPATTPTSSWVFLQPFLVESMSEEALHSKVKQFVAQCGHSLEQVDSLYQSFVMQSKQTYA
jgi:hypothetical protein